MKSAAVLAFIVVASALVALAAPAPTTNPAAPAVTANPYDGAAPVAPDTQIDNLVFARLDKLGIEKANLCSDAVFVRRAYLDVIGTLPTEKEARDFLDSKDPKRRSALIDKLLERDEFAGYWAMKWCDLLRVRAEFPINLWPNAAQAYHRWVRSSIKANIPYDQLARELLTSSGSNFRFPQVNFYRAMQSRQSESIAQVVALTFLGERAEKWPKDKLAAVTVFFSQVGFKYTGEWKEEIVYFDLAKAASQPAGSGTTKPAFPDGTKATIPDGVDPRKCFADWLVQDKNPYFARAIVNRIWFWLLGRGIIHEPDDIRPDNPASNPELLAYLEKELVASHYDLKHIYRLILNSQTYQLSSVARSKRPEAAANFASYPLRQLDAEVLVDALCQITGTAERYSSPVPEPFTFVPDNVRSIDLPDASLTSTVLEMFGRPPRGSGLLLERKNAPTADQRLYLLNSSSVRQKLEQGPALRNILRPRNGPKEIATQLYLTILSRPPTDAELKVVDEYAKGGGPKLREAAVDLAWALINTDEFLFRH